MRDPNLAGAGISAECLGNKEHLPRFRQKHQQRGADVPISLGHGYSPVYMNGPENWGNVTEALSNAPSDGFGQCGDVGNLETKRVLAGPAYCLG